MDSANCALDESPWGDWYGRPITARFLAERLRPYGIFSQNLRLLDGQKKSYTRASFAESWDRYLPDVPPSVPAELHDLHALSRIAGSCSDLVLATYGRWTGSRDWLI